VVENFESDTWNLRFEGIDAITTDTIQTDLANLVKLITKIYAKDNSIGFAVNLINSNYRKWRPSNDIAVSRLQHKDAIRLVRFILDRFDYATK